MIFLVYWLDKYCSGRGDMGNLMKYETRAIVNGIMIAHITVSTTDVPHITYSYVYIGCTCIW